jgi:hypothetical protein
MNDRLSFCLDSFLICGLLSGTFPGEYRSRCGVGVSWSWRVPIVVFPFGDVLPTLELHCLYCTLDLRSVHAEKYS